MKVFMCKRSGGYSGGLAVVAANSKEEAYVVFHESTRYNWMLDGIDRESDCGDYTDNPLKCDSDYYRKDDWFEVRYLIANVDEPCVIEEGGCTE